MIFFSFSSYFRFAALKTLTVAFALLSFGVLSSNDYSTVRAGQPKLHALLIFDTHDPRSGNERQFELDRLRRVLFRAFEQHGISHRLDLTVLDGANATPSRVFQYFNQLKSETNDTLLVMFSGHGGMDEDLRHYLALQNGGHLVRSELRAAMLSRPHRLAVLLSIACSSVPGETTRNAGFVSNQANLDYRKKVHRHLNTSGTLANVNLIQELFFDTEGIVDVGASFPREYGYTIRGFGSIFFTCLLDKLTETKQSLDIDSSGRVAWPELLDHVDASVQRYCGQKQVSYTFFLGESPKTYDGRRIAIKNDLRYPLYAVVSYEARFPDGRWRWNTPEKIFLVDPFTVFTVIKEPVRKVRVKAFYYDNKDIEREFNQYWIEPQIIASSQRPHASKSPQVKTFLFNRRLQSKVKGKQRGGLR